MGTASVLPFKPEPVVSGSKHFEVEHLDKLHHPMVEEPVCKGWVLNDCLGTGCPGVRRLSGQMSRASSGHWRSAALCVKKMVGRPSVSTMENR